MQQRVAPVSTGHRPFGSHQGYHRKELHKYCSSSSGDSNSSNLQGQTWMSHPWSCHLCRLLTLYLKAFMQDHIQFSGYSILSPAQLLGVLSWHEAFILQYQCWPDDWEMRSERHHSSFYEIIAISIACANQTCPISGVGSLLLFQPSRLSNHIIITGHQDLVSGVEGSLLAPVGLLVTRLESCWQNTSLYLICLNDHGHSTDQQMVSSSTQMGISGSSSHLPGAPAAPLWHTDCSIERLLSSHWHSLPWHRIGLWIQRIQSLPFDPWCPALILSSVQLILVIFKLVKPLDPVWKFLPDWLCVPPPWSWEELHTGPTPAL